MTIEMTLPHTKIELPSAGARTRAATISSAMRAAPQMKTIALSMRLESDLALARLHGR